MTKKWEVRQTCHAMRHETMNYTLNCGVLILLILKSMLNSKCDVLSSCILFSFLSPKVMAS